MSAQETGTSIAEAARLLAAGGLVAFPTETVYGLGARARDPVAVARIFAAKGRPADHPLIVHLGHRDWMTAWADPIPEVAWRLAEAFWPGPLTLILRRRPGVPDAVTGGLDTVALRVPSHPQALALLAALGEGIAAPSANRYGRVSPTHADHVREELGGTIDGLVDGGPCSVGVESTIVDLSAGTVRLLRPGAVTAEQIEAVLGTSTAPTNDRPAPRAPGSDASHYAPLAKVVLANQGAVQDTALDWASRGLSVGLLSPELPAPLEGQVQWLPLPASAEDQARVLYARLREADHLGLAVLVASLPPETGLGQALRDRLRRAAGLGEPPDTPPPAAPELS